MARTDITLFDAAQIHSANTTSSSDSGALMIASHVRCTCIREKAEYIAANEEVNIALWQTMPVPMKAMYFIPPTSGMKLPSPYPSASMYNSGSAMLPSTDAIASFRHTSRLRRHTGTQRSERPGGRSNAEVTIRMPKRRKQYSVAYAYACPSPEAHAQQLCSVAQLASGQLDE